MREPAASLSDIRKGFEEARFSVKDSSQYPEALEVEKGPCRRRIIRERGGAWVPFGPPYFILRGLECELEDRGYQKFWYHQGKRFPIRKTELETLHRFDEEVRFILGTKNLYNESLGSTCARTLYDRLSGRPEGTTERSRQ
jgi:hypothetical protein